VLTGAPPSSKAAIREVFVGESEIFTNITQRKNNSENAFTFLGQTGEPALRSRKQFAEI